jgi:HEPN domain-containing protein
MANSKATTLLNTAAHDYAAARCLLLNGLVSGGLAMGAQAIEKFLKAYILLKNPAADVRKLQHSLVDLLSAADQLSPGLALSKYSVLTDRFERHYRSRYPDNPNASISMTSAEIFELDEFIMYINDNMPCPFVAKYRTGLYALVTFSLHGRTVTPWERWIKERNRALAPRWPRIEADFRATLRNLHPDTFG